MTVALLDINDCNLRLWGDGPLVQSPGYALLDSGEYRFGQSARGRARLQPRDINNRFWWQLGTAPLQPALGPARHSADLVHAHLSQLHREAGSPAELVLACPGSMQREQLSLLLGIAQQCAFRVVGLVDRSALVGSLHVARFHLEMQLHQALVTQLQQNGDELGATRSTVLPGAGLLHLQERLAELIAAAFIRQTRFDPRRKAATEQELYDALPRSLEALAQQSECNLEVAGYRARIARAEVAGIGERLLAATREVVGDTGEGLLADPLLALLPGFAEAFPGVSMLAQDAPWQAAKAHGQRLVNREGPLSFVATLPRLARPQGPAAATSPAPLTTAKPPLRQPTHVLNGATAHPLNGPVADLAGGAGLRALAQGWVLQGKALVNGRAAGDGHALQAGDVITAADREFRLIEVVDDGS